MKSTTSEEKTLHELFKEAASVPLELGVGVCAAKGDGHIRVADVEPRRS